MAESRPAVSRFVSLPAAGRRWWRMFLLLLLLAAQHSVTADLREISVEFIDERYHLASEAWFAASRRDVYRVLTDYDLFVQFSSAFVETRNVPDDDEGRPRFFTRMQGCILFFCKTVVRQGHLLLKPHTEIVAIAAPEASDFSYSRERWRLEPSGDGTLLYYDFEMEPAFWVPPLIGPFVIKRKLASDGAEAIDRIEALALGRTPEP